MDLKKLDSDGRTLATYAIDKQSPLCLKVALMHANKHDSIDIIILYSRSS